MDDTVCRLQLPEAKRAASTRLQRRKLNHFLHSYLLEVCVETWTDQEAGADDNENKKHIYIYS